MTDLAKEINLLFPEKEININLKRDLNYYCYYPTESRLCETSTNFEEDFGAYNSDIIGGAILLGLASYALYHYWT